MLFARFGQEATMLTLFLADTEIEVVPREIRGHPAVRSSAVKRKREPAKMILDSALHHSAMTKLPDYERRGRPDMVHFFLAAALDSILNLDGGLKVLIHTRGDNVIEVSPEVRLPKNYPRFVGLMESLFEKGVVPPGADHAGALLFLHRNMSFEKALHHYGIDRKRLAVLSPEGNKTDIQELFRKLSAENPGGGTADICMVVGGFSHGDFRSPVYGLASESVCISPHLLKVWTVASEVLVAYRSFLQSSPVIP